MVDNAHHIVVFMSFNDCVHDVNISATSGQARKQAENWVPFKIIGFDEV